MIGWRPPEYGPDDVRGLFLATYEDGELVYRGGVGGCPPPPAHAAEPALGPPGG